MINCAVTAQLICVFVFAYAKSQFSHDEAHIIYNVTFMRYDFDEISAMKGIHMEKVL